MTLQYWENGVKKSLPTWATPSVENYKVIDERIPTDPIVSGTAKTVSVVDDNSAATVESLYLENMTGNQLDYEGRVVGVTRLIIAGEPEEDDSYRERIRRFWQNADSGNLEASLNNQFPQVGVFRVFEAPYTYCALDSQLVGPYLDQNSFLFPVEVPAVTPGVLFPLSTRAKAHAIAVHVRVSPTSPPLASVQSDIQQVIKELKVYGVIAYLVAWLPPV